MVTTGHLSHIIQESGLLTSVWGGHSISLENWPLLGLITLIGPEGLKAQALSHDQGIIGS